MPGKASELKAYGTDEERRDLEAALNLLEQKMRIRDIGREFPYNRYQAGIMASTLISLGYLFSGAFIYIYFIVMVKVLADQVRQEDNLRYVVENVNQPLQFYIGFGAIFALIFTAAGLTVGDIPYSLLDALLGGSSLNG